MEDWSRRDGPNGGCSLSNGLVPIRTGKHHPSLHLEMKKIIPVQITVAILTPKTMDTDWYISSRH
jgi:hypothetical protein